MSEGSKRTNRTKILASGIRARVRRPGETEEHMESWRNSILKRSGHAAIVFYTQASFDEFLERGKALDRYQALVERVMAKYFAGELVEKRNDLSKKKAFSKGVEEVAHV